MAIELATARRTPGIHPQGDRPISVAGVSLVADCAGALYWPDEGLLAVADLHLEKGSSFAARGILLPPYDTATTLARVGALVARYAPRVVIALGDNFHDGEGPARLAPRDRATVLGLQRGRDWVWITGNHDPDPADGVGGVFVRTIAVGALTFRHEPTRAHVPEKWSPVFRNGHAPNEETRAYPGSIETGYALEAVDGEIAGHLHPVARVATRGRTVSRRCFVTDRKRLVMPAFGAFTGGLNIRDRAFAEVFTTLAFTAHVLGDQRLYAIAAKRCLAD